MAATDDDWALYAGHRARLTDEILSSVRNGAGRLCLLGAGKCNDVDLQRLSRTFSEIHLVDIDAAALAHAVSRQPSPVRERLRLHAGVDLSGFAKRPKKWKRRPPVPGALDALAASACQSLVASLPGPFDVVVSACVLTQMSFTLRDALGEGHPMLAPIRIALIATHLSTMVGLTAVGGASLFVCDLTSSTFYPLGDLPPDRDLRDVLNHIVETGAGYFSANPHLVRAQLLTHKLLRDRVDEPELRDPWLWTGPHGRTYFVYAFRVPRC